MGDETRRFPMEVFDGLCDERSQRNQLHALPDIIFLTICAVVSGADAWTEVENFGETKLDWLRKYVPLANGIPSHDTLGRVFAMIDPLEFERCFSRWVSGIARTVGGEVISIDGKTLRGSHDRHSGKGAIHMVSAWANSNRIVLGQVKTSEKSNEITAIPSLLATLVLAGCLVTIDAMGCQRDIVAQIREQKADYLITVKANQPSLLQGICRSFDLLKPDLRDEEVDSGYGRVETRRCEVITDLRWIENKADWKGLAAVVRVTRTRYIKLDGSTSTDTAYLITSSSADAKTINNAARMHWGVENSLHWVMDVVFSEDDARNRQGDSDHNMAIIRRIALNMIKTDSSRKASIKIKRHSAAMDDHYRAILIGI
jgi:predicted transposase YbfD/YdcC